MIDIGFLGLDSSHATTFADVIEVREDATLTTVWDGGDVRSPADARAFTDRYDATLADEPSKLLEEVDAVMVLTVNWDTHADLAAPFLEAGIPTLIDKPLAGSIAHLEAIERMASKGCGPLFGGSSVPFHPSLEPVSEPEPGSSLFCVGHNDPFYYGSHLVEIVRTFVGTDWQSVSPAEDPGKTANIVFEDGTYATLRFDGPGPRNDGDHFIVLDADRGRVATINAYDEAYEQMYRAYLNEFVEIVFDGDDDGHRDRLLDSGRLLLAVHAALENGRTVTRESDVLADVHVDGEAFLEEYRASR